MCSPGVDELSMMTYLSQYPGAKLKTGAPLRPRTNRNKVRAYGPGTAAIIPPPAVGGGGIKRYPVAVLR